MESSCTFKRISSAKRDIEKIPAPLRSHISSPNLLPSRQDLLARSGVHTWLLPVISYLPLQNSLPNHKTHIAGKRLSMFVTIQTQHLHSRLGSANITSVSLKESIKLLLKETLSCSFHYQVSMNVLSLVV
ncbi:hypothetical protein AVEN_138949-1 [Araneus ventricosus]|uniref:Uncharacterized protein n=1 Tax=Araneus ventricosus TaxID=182803 RepID=A0A4Y2MSK2_ARAVE|nr:hypothetical protein AVEN_138949-1 [Araneus ventricosus]